MAKTISIFWFRRDLRLKDNVGLFHALTSGVPVLPIFIFDSEILKELPEADARVTFIHDTLQDLNTELQSQQQSGIAMYYGKPQDVFKTLAKTHSIASVYTNQDYEPYAIARDQEIASFLKSKQIGFQTFKDQVIFERDEIVKSDGTPYKVYTPYSKKWLEKFNTEGLQTYPSETHLDKLLTSIRFPNLTLEAIGFRTSSQKVEHYTTHSTLINSYEATRNFPAIENGTSKVGPHLRFGTVSIRALVTKAAKSSNTIYLKELIWREFFMQILWHFPHTLTQSFKPQYDHIQWRNNKTEFELWCKGETGYPLVDAGMRELNATGFMHNRVRMLVGSFLCKHLLIDWRLGEAYFAEKLHDYEMSSNIGNWQWVAGCGVDAAPYFRIFNPTTQVEKFDKAHQYIKKWVPDYQELSYTAPIVDHKFARERCLRVYKEALNN
jgi:deoxyribodipyrimidine photo-lyase